MNILKNLGSALMSVGGFFLDGGYGLWTSACEIAIGYAKQNPIDMSNAWLTVTGYIFSIMISVGSALAVLFFVLGWLNESIDIRTTFTLENMFRFFARYILAISLIANAETLAIDITKCVMALISTLSVSTNTVTMNSFFDGMRSELNATGADGTSWIAYGFVALIGGFIGGFVIIVTAFELITSVLARMFKMLLCIPFAPVAFAGFAGGKEFSQSGIAWIKTYVGYCLEGVVILLALSISMNLFKDNAADAFGEAEGVVGVILQICGFCLPMITAVACVRTADTVVRRCLGL